LPIIYYNGANKGCDIVVGILLGVILATLFNSIKEYGIRRLILFPETVEVRRVF
jgi:hypothetical protein